MNLEKDKICKVNSLFNLESFKNLLANPTGAHMFKEFLEKERSTNNLDFYFQVESYKNSPKVDKKMAGKIYSTYIHDGADLQVNIYDEDRLKTIECLKKPTLDMFDVPQRVVFVMMYNDSYRRFLQEFVFLPFFFLLFSSLFSSSTLHFPLFFFRHLTIDLSNQLTK